MNPQMAEEGENLRAHLAAKHGTTPEGSAQARARLTELGAALGFTFSYADDMRMENTFRAQQFLAVPPSGGPVIPWRHACPAMEGAEEGRCFPEPQQIRDLGHA